MKIGDEVYVHGYVDEIRKGTYVDIVIIRNKGGYFGTDASEVILADRKTEPNCSEKPNNCEDEPMKTADYCDICKRDMCEVCVVADATNPYCVPSHYEIRHEPKTEPQTEVQIRKEIPVICAECDHVSRHNKYLYCELVHRTVYNAKPEWCPLPNLFVADDEPKTDYTPDCPFCKRYGTEECLGSDCRHYKTYKVEPKTEPQTDPCDGCVYDDGKHLMYCMNCKGIAWKTEPPKVEDEPQTERSE